MKKSLGCADLGVPTCTFEVRSEIRGEIVDGLMGHVSQYHPEKVRNLTDKQRTDMIHQIDGAIK
jgi:predicted small metal-binding protein